MWELNCEESWVPKNWCFWTVVLEKTLEGPLDCKEIQPVHPKGDQSWVFIGRTDAEAETPILWPPDVKSWLIWKDPDAGKDWGQAEKGTAEDEMIGWHHQLNGHGFGWTPGVGDGQGALACCGSWGCKGSDMTEQLNWTELNNYNYVWASLVAQLVKNPPAMQETPVWFLGWEDPLEKGYATHSSILGLPCGPAGKESTCSAGDLGSISVLGRSPGEGKGYPLQYSGLENSMDCIVQGVTKSWTPLSNCHFHLLCIK